MTAVKIDKPAEPGPEQKPDVPTPAPTPIGPARVFRDKAYMSRTLIMSDGRGLDVRQGKVTAFGDDQYEYLSAHPGLERVTE